MARRFLPRVLRDGPQPLHLCRRCIRGCAELVGNHTLGLRQRGADSMLTADMDVPFGESSCVSCGTCLQVCPTGALMDRTSAYGGVEEQVQRVKTTCQFCSTGCADGADRPRQPRPPRGE